MWEYQLQNYTFKLVSELEERLNKEGKKGWIVIHYQEQNPGKFGDDYKSKVLYKRKVNKIRQLLSGQKRWSPKPIS
jgi:hypothetical protein